MVGSRFVRAVVSGALATLLLPTPARAADEDAKAQAARAEGVVQNVEYDLSKDQPSAFTTAALLTEVLGPLPAGKRKPLEKRLAAALDGYLDRRAQALEACYAELLSANRSKWVYVTQCEQKAADPAVLAWGIPIGKAGERHAAALATMDAVRTDCTALVDAPLERGDVVAAKDRAIELGCLDKVRPRFAGKGEAWCADPKRGSWWQDPLDAKLYGCSPEQTAAMQARVDALAAKDAERAATSAAAEKLCVEDVERSLAAGDYAAARTRAQAGCPSTYTRVVTAEAAAKKAAAAAAAAEAAAAEAAERAAVRRRHEEQILALTAACTAESKRLLGAGDLLGAARTAMSGTDACKQESAPTILAALRKRPVQGCTTAETWVLLNRAGSGGSSPAEWEAAAAACSVQLVDDAKNGQWEGFSARWGMLDPRWPTGGASKDAVLAALVEGLRAHPYPGEHRRPPAGAERTREALLWLPRSRWAAAVFWQLANRYDLVVTPLELGGLPALPLKNPPVRPIWVSSLVGDCGTYKPKPAPKEPYIEIRATMQCGADVKEEREAPVTMSVRDMRLVTDAYGRQVTEFYDRSYTVPGAVTRTATEWASAKGTVYVDGVVRGETDGYTHAENLDYTRVPEALAFDLTVPVDPKAIAITLLKERKARATTDIERLDIAIELLARGGGNSDDLQLVDDMLGYRGPDERWPF